MKVALVHDYLSEFGGAERVLQALHEIWPEAPIYTAFVKRDSTAGRAFAKARVRESIFASLIKYKNLYSPLRFLTPLIWKSFDFSDYDLVFTSSSWYMTRGFRIGLKTKIICYCHTPPRYLYGYPTSIEWQRYKLVKLYAVIVNHFLRQCDYKSAQQVDEFMANSENVKKRVAKFYRRDSTVIYPPVEAEKIIKATKGLKLKDYYLVVSRVVGAKGIGLAVEAAKKAGFKLKIIGEKAGLRWLGKKLEKEGNGQVEFLGRVSDEKLYRYYGQCKAFLALASDEDFGITVVEAMAAGRPVIAFRGGGYLETVVDSAKAKRLAGQGPTGVFFDELTVESLIGAIKQLRRLSIEPLDCINQSRRFSKERFKEEIENFVRRRFK